MGSLEKHVGGPAAHGSKSDVLVVSNSTNVRSRRNAVWDEESKSSPSVLPESSSSCPTDRQLMPPPMFTPARQQPRKKNPVIAPISFVSNSIQSSTFGSTNSRGTDSPRNTVKYDCNYKYTKPNYIVTDVPDLWSDSKIHVVQEAVSDTLSPADMVTVKADNISDPDPVPSAAAPLVVASEKCDVAEGVLVEATTHSAENMKCEAENLLVLDATDVVDEAEAATLARKRPKSRSERHRRPSNERSQKRKHEESSSSSGENKRHKKRKKRSRSESEVNVNNESTETASTTNSHRRKERKHHHRKRQSSKNSTKDDLKPHRKSRSFSRATSSSRFHEQIAHGCEKASTPRSSSRLRSSESSDSASSDRCKSEVVACNSGQNQAQYSQKIPAATSDEQSDHLVKDIFDLIEKHLAKSSDKEDGQISSESDTSDTESVVSVSQMSVFESTPAVSTAAPSGIQHKEKSEPIKKSRTSSSTSRSTSRNNRSPPRTSGKENHRRQRSLSPVHQRRSPLCKSDVRSRRRSISPTLSVVSRQRSLSRAPRDRRHRASSFDTIASNQIDYVKLREIAVKNAIEFRRQGKIPPQYAMSAEERAIWRSGGKTLDDLTAFCKKMSQRDRSNRTTKDDDRAISAASELPLVEHHPYHVKDRPLKNEILMRIQDFRSLPIRSNQERAIQNLPLRELFPVSSGSTHRDLSWERVVSHEKPHREPIESHLKERKKPVEKDALTVEDEPMTLQRQLATQGPPPDYRIPISFSDKLRLLKFQRELAMNPDNPEVLSQMQETQQQMMDWASQFSYRGPPGQFSSEVSPTASTVPLHLPWERQAWARKDQLMYLTPVSGKGQYLLQKMGWEIGQAIGLRNKGQLEPLKMAIKMDKRGLVAEDERGGRQAVFSNGVKSVSLAGTGSNNLHPCSALNEVCTKRGWGTPAFDLIMESGSSHRKTFLFQVKINGITYRPTVTGSSKKIAKAEASKFCLQAMGVTFTSHV